MSKIKRNLLAALALTLAGAGAAHAALPATVTAQLDEGAADGLVLGGATLAVIIAAVVFKYLRRGA